MLALAVAARLAGGGDFKDATAGKLLQMRGLGYYCTLARSPFNATPAISAPAWHS